MSPVNVLEVIAYELVRMRQHADLSFLRQLAADAKRAAPESQYVDDLEELAYKILEDRVRAIATEHGYGLDDETPPPVGGEEEATLQ